MSSTQCGDLSLTRLWCANPRSKLERRCKARHSARLGAIPPVVAPLTWTFVVWWRGVIAIVRLLIYRSDEVAGRRACAYAAGRVSRLLTKPVNSLLTPRNRGTGAA